MTALQPLGFASDKISIKKATKLETIGQLPNIFYIFLREILQRSKAITHYVLKLTLSTIGDFLKAYGLGPEG